MFLSHLFKHIRPFSPSHFHHSHNHLGLILLYKIMSTKWKVLSLRLKPLGNFRLRKFELSTTKKRWLNIECIYFSFFISFLYSLFFFFCYCLFPFAIHLDCMQHWFQSLPISLLVPREWRIHIVEWKKKKKMISFLKLNTKYMRRKKQNHILI